MYGCLLPSTGWERTPPHAPALRDMFIISTTLTSSSNIIASLPAPVQERGRISSCSDGKNVGVSGLSDEMRGVHVYNTETQK